MFLPTSSLQATSGWGSPACSRSLSPTCSFSPGRTTATFSRPPRFPTPLWPYWVIFSWEKLCLRCAGSAFWGSAWAFLSSGIRIRELRRRRKRARVLIPVYYCCGRHRRGAVCFPGDEGGRRSSRLPAGGAGWFCFSRDARGLDVDWYRDDDAGLLLAFGDALHRKREFRRSRDRSELRGWRLRRHVVLARTHQPAALARRRYRLRRGYTCLAQQTLRPRIQLRIFTVSPGPPASLFRS